MRRARGCFRVFLAAAGLALLAFSIACNPIENDSQSASRLILDSLMGLDVDGNDADFLNSDVVIVNAATNGQSWRADSATATFSVTPYDTDPVLGTSPYYDVQITRYIVTYSRSDGRNVPGRDVP
jgi:hypothetical protein